ncbi:MAG: NosD domain-containing protein [Candidatus Paceibacterota bacterium]|jgi:parallel beta-helix repeat protein|nr:right-handed parallel beta-helix repeat-containing protein [Candidatus Paceibacterota bacterium]
MYKKFLESPIHHKIIFATIALVVLLLLTFAGIFYAKKAFTYPAPSFPNYFRMPTDPSHMRGETDGTGTHFAITDSEYLNITLDSTETVDMRLTSIPKVITMMFEATTTATRSASSGQATAQITLSGLASNTTYYKYEDDYHHLAQFTSDNNGAYTYTQDISVQHFVFIQTVKSTKFIVDNITGGDCSTIGTWNAGTKTCTLTQDLTETVQIDSDGVTFDGNGHKITITPDYTANGVYISGKASTTVKNLTVNGAYEGIFLFLNSGVRVSKNTFTGNMDGIYLRFGGDNAIKSNVVSDNYRNGITVYDSTNNQILENTAMGNNYSDFNIQEDYIGSAICDNIITGNIGFGGRPIGFFNSPTTLNGGTFSELILCDADSSDIRNVTIKSSDNGFGGGGLLAFYTDHANFNNSTSNDNIHGVHLHKSHSNIFENVTVMHDGYNVLLDNSNSNILKNISAGSDGFIQFTLANDNELDGATIDESAGIGFYYQSNSNRLHNFTFPDQCQIYTDNRGSTGNLIYNNNFIGGQCQITGMTGNSFNLPKPIGGNYWSDYDTPAEGCSDVDSDGFCDAPYVFVGAQDNLPWTRQDGWKVTVDIGQAASDLAKLVVDGQYLGDGNTWGGKGWDPNQAKYVTPSEIFAGYHFWNNAISVRAIDFGAGVDCSGLVQWSFNRSFDPNKSLLKNVIRYDNADGQFRNNSVPLTELELRPGDLLFLDKNLNGVRDHVGMFVGGNAASDVVESHSPIRGIISSSKIEFKTRDGFIENQSIRRVVISPTIAGQINAGSPIDLTVTDPEGFTLTPETAIQTDDELLREVPGELYYTENVLGSDGHPEDIIYWPVQKNGDYLITVTAEPDAAPTETFDLTFISGTGSTTIVASNIPISEIPAQSYIIRSSDGNFEKVIPAKIKIKPETMNLASGGIITVALQFDPGFGVVVHDIATSTLRLAGARPIRTAIEVEEKIPPPKNEKTSKKQKDHGEYEDDEEMEVLTLVAKFRTKDLTGVSVGKKVPLVLTARLSGGMKAEGTDTVEIISKGAFSVLSDAFTQLAGVLTATRKLFAQLPGL